MKQGAIIFTVRPAVNTSYDVMIMPACLRRYRAPTASTQALLPNKNRFDFLAVAQFMPHPLDP